MAYRLQLKDEEESGRGWCCQVVREGQKGKKVLGRIKILMAEVQEPSCKEMGRPVGLGCMVDRVQ